MPPSELLSLLGLLAIPIAVLVLYFSRQPDVAGARHWAVSWTLLWLAGFVIGFASLEALAVMRVTSSLGITFLAAGAIVFAGHRLPRPVLPAMAFLAVGTGVLVLGDQLDLARRIAVVPEVAILLVAAWLLMRRPSRQRFAPRTLSVLIALLGLLNVYELAHEIRPEHVELQPMIYWICVAFGLGVSQLMCVEVRRREDLLALQAEREGERRRAVLERAILAAGLQTAPIGYCVVDGIGRVLYASWSGIAPSDEPEQDWTGSSLAVLLKKVLGALEVDQKTVTTLMRLTREPDLTLRDFEFSYEWQGRRRSLVLFSAPVVDSAADWQGRVIFIRDVTEERHLEAELRQSQKMETLGNLAGGVAHDFNNQLAAISGNVELASLTSGEETRRHLDTIKHSVDHCAMLTRGLLSFARRAPIDVVAADANRLVDETVQLLRSTLPKSIELEVDLPPEAPGVMVDPHHLQQILMNLCINSRDAIRERDSNLRGSIGIRLRRATDVVPPRHVEGKAGTEYLAFEVSDDGVGIPEGIYDRIFEPFFTTKGPGDGTGLGLSVVHGLAHSLRGWVEVESDHGSETVFRVLLPAADRAANTPRSAGFEIAPGGGARILLVDDEDTVREVVQQILERKGYSVTAAEDAEQALAWFTEHQEEVDLLVSDVSMPGMDGETMAREMRALRPDLSVVLMSGHFGPNAGVDDDFSRVAKPFRAAELLDLLVRLTRERIDAAAAN